MTAPEYEPQPVNEDYEAPVWTPEESNEANDGYTLKTWVDHEAMHRMNG